MGRFVQFLPSELPLVSGSRQTAKSSRGTRCWTKLKRKSLSIALFFASCGSILLSRDFMADHAQLLYLPNLLSFLPPPPSSPLPRLAQHKQSISLLLFSFPAITIGTRGGGGGRGGKGTEKIKSCCFCLHTRNCATRYSATSRSSILPFLQHCLHLSLSQ